MIPDRWTKRNQACSSHQSPFISVKLKWSCFNMWWDTVMELKHCIWVLVQSHWNMKIMLIVASDWKKYCPLWNHHCITLLTTVLTENNMASEGDGVKKEAWSIDKICMPHHNTAPAPWYSITIIFAKPYITIVLQPLPWSDTCRLLLLLKMFINYRRI